MELPRDWSEFIGLLCAHRVQFLVVGGHAMAIHGRPRFTEDLDVFIAATPANVRRLAAALEEFGFHDLAAASEEFLRHDRMASLGSKPLRIDITNSIDGVSFATAWKSRVRARFGERTVGFIGYRQFLRNKKASGRPKDLLDLELLAESRPPRRSRPRRR
jgi:hypothetical protein